MHHPLTQFPLSLMTRFIVSSLTRQPSTWVYVRASVPVLNVGLTSRLDTMSTYLSASSTLTSYTSLTSLNSKKVKIIFDFFKASIGLASFHSMKIKSSKPTTVQLLIFHSTGDTKAPNKMAEGSVYNMITELVPEDVKCQIKEHAGSVVVGEMARVILDNAIHIASVWKAEGKGDSDSSILRTLINMISLPSTMCSAILQLITNPPDSVFRSDHGRLLTLACKVYRDVPENLENLVYHKQEMISQSRLLILDY